MSFSSLNFVVEHSSAKDPYLQNGDPDPDLFTNTGVNLSFSKILIRPLMKTRIKTETKN